MAAPRSTRTSFACAVRKIPGSLSVVEPSFAGVKPETPANGDVADAPDWVALWAPVQAPEGGAPTTPGAESFRLDLRCDVVDLMVANKPPATSAKVVLSKERVAQGHLGPCAGGACVATFNSTEERQRFVDTVKYWRLSADEAAALRAMAAAASAGNERSAGEHGATGAHTAEIDSKAVISRVAVKPENAEEPPQEMPSGVEVISAAQRAKERSWARHDATLRQLFDELVTSGVISEEEFAIAHREEKAAFFSEAPGATQRLGLDSLTDALSDLVDPVTHQLRPITEQTAANVFAQSPALAAVYRERVRTSEDEIVFWDAVVRRVLFLSRTVLDQHDATATKANDAAADGAANSNSGHLGSDGLSAAWNGRSAAALRLLEEERGRENGKSAGAKRMVAPSSADVAAEVAHRRRETGRHRREAGDAEAVGGLTASGEGRDSLFEHVRLPDLEAVGPGDAAGSAAAAASAEDAVDTDEDDRAWWQWRVANAFGLDPAQPVSIKRAANDTSDVASAIRRALDARDEGTGTAAGGGLWGSMFSTVERRPLRAAIRQNEHPPQGPAARAVPLQLRTCHSLHRLFFRQLLACKAQARALRGVPPSPAEKAARDRCADVLAALKRARDKAFADPPPDAGDSTTGPWAEGCRKVEALVARAVEAHEEALREWR